MTFLLFEGRQTEKEDDLQILRDAVKEINRDDLERKIQRHFATGKKNEKCEIKKYLIFNASFLYLFVCCCCFVLFVFLAGGGRGQELALVHLSNQVQRLNIRFSKVLQLILFSFPVLSADIFLFFYSSILLIKLITLNCKRANIYTALKMNLFVEDFFSRCGHFRSFLLCLRVY